MPTYKYINPITNEEIEVLHKMCGSSEEDLKTLPPNIQEQISYIDEEGNRKFFLRCFGANLIGFQGGSSVNSRSKR